MPVGIGNTDMMDVEKIMQHLPHRYPFLLVDRVVDFEAGEYLKAFKNVTINEPFFQGHFPGKPIMPGVLIMEALAQTCGLYAFSSHSASEQDKKYLYLFAGIDKARFRRSVLPGDRLDLVVTPLSQKRNMLKVSAEASVDGKLVASAEIMCAEQEMVVD